MKIPCRTVCKKKSAKYSCYIYDLFVNSFFFTIYITVYHNYVFVDLVDSLLKKRLFLLYQFMMANGTLVRTLIHTDVTKYLSFKAVDGSYVFSKGKVVISLCSRPVFHQHYVS